MNEELVLVAPAIVSAVVGIATVAALVIARVSRQSASERRGFPRPYLLIVPPSPFSPGSDLAKFIQEWSTNKWKDHPQARGAVARAKRDLARNAEVERMFQKAPEAASVKTRPKC